ncbi:protein hemingway [Drosophila grimshawi]|uniref:GH18340 n=1 Tax=Drosophila grimshawi TaxID=7222 RepID=B4JF26_DROGR|nr:protein hemingway [Drosophila grimshawi]EDV93307.1 GH18340 [Drosophila grimshawi]
MTAPLINSDEDYYMDEPFDEESLSEVEEEQEIEEGLLEGSDSQTDSDVEAEYLRGNPHARRLQMYQKLSGGGSGFSCENKLTYASSSSEDDTHVVITKTVAEVNQLSLRNEHMDEETISVRTLVPNTKQIDDGDQTELEMEGEDEIGDGEETIFDNYDNESEQSNEEKEEGVEIGQLEEEDELEPENQYEMTADQQQPQNQDLVDIVDANESEMESSLNSDSEVKTVPVPAPRNIKRGHKYHPDLARRPVGDVDDAPQVPQLHLPDNYKVPDINGLDCDGLGTAEQLNVKFLEQQMQQMSEMIMKTYRLHGGTTDNSAFEHLAMATDLLKKQGKEMSEMCMEEEYEESKASTSVCSEKLSRRNCRCPSSTDVHQPEQEPFFMDECGQGDGLLRYPHLGQQHSARIDCRVSSVTPSSYNSDSSGFHIEVGRPRSVISSEVNFKNLGRKSFSFTNPQVREIERANNILLKKMMNVKTTIKPSISAVKSSTSVQAKKQPPPRLTSAAVNRKKNQRQIDLDNDVLKRKLEAVGSRRPLFK